MKLIHLLFCFFIMAGIAQSQNDSLSQKGVLSLGLRSSIGLVYEHDWNKTAFGTGAQFRLRFSDRVNSDWFIDFLTGDLEDFGKRSDVHIGWSVLYYPLKNQHIKVQPYVLAGHCFEFLTLQENAHPQNSASRKSASVQAGLGFHVHLSPRADISFESQYMMHFGTNIIITQEPQLTFTKPRGVLLQDHLLFHFSINYSIADLW